MKMFTSIAILVIAATVLSGCPKKGAIVKEEAKIEAEEKMKAEAEAKAKAELEAKMKVEAEAKAAAEARARAEAAAKAELGAKEDWRLEDIHFDFDMYEIKGRDKDMLRGLADLLLKDKNANILLEGHADDRGNSSYNLALGERRAQSAKEYLVTLGVSAKRISSISYGQEKLVCGEPNEDCWWRNRRVHFLLQEQK